MSQGARFLDALAEERNDTESRGQRRAEYCAKKGLEMKMSDKLFITCIISAVTILVAVGIPSIEYDWPLWPMFIVIGTLGATCFVLLMINLWTS